MSSWEPYHAYTTFLIVPVLRNNVIRPSFQGRIPNNRVFMSSRHIGEINHPYPHPGVMDGRSELLTAGIVPTRVAVRVGQLDYLVRVLVRNSVTSVGSAGEKDLHIGSISEQRRETTIPLEHLFRMLRSMEVYAFLI